MLFNSPIFLFVFLPITYVIFWLLRTQNARYIWLATTGYVFYGYWNPKFCLLMLFSTLVSYLAGLGFLSWGDDLRRRKWLLIAPIATDLTLLGYFKYTDFLLASFNSLITWAGSEPRFDPLNIILPVGISFYTFHTITYIVDAYRGVIKPTRNFFEFACYVSLFSQLVAGPIVRFKELQQDLEDIEKKDRRSYLDRGFSYFTIGMFQKVLIADSIAAVIDPALQDTASLSSIGAWLCTFGYAYQLYFDFAGYSNMAIGLGFLFGMHIPINFNSPYKALNPSDFWRRWHISLSRCLRDYLYVPLGGSRGGEWLTYRNLMITMLLGGLWHGAAWTFVVWGAYHGLLLVAYRRYAKYWDAQPEALQRAGTFSLVLIGWTIFRAATWNDATALLYKMFVPQSGVELLGMTTLMLMLGIAGLLAHLGPNASEMRHQSLPRLAAVYAAGMAVCLFRVVGSENSPFLYFQF